MSYSHLWCIQVSWMFSWKTCSNIMARNKDWCALVDLLCHYCTSKDACCYERINMKKIPEWEYKMVVACSAQKHHSEQIHMQCLWWYFLTCLAVVHMVVIGWVTHSENIKTLFECFISDYLVVCILYGIVRMIPDWLWLQPNAVNNNVK